MSISVGTSDGGIMCDINTTPLIDVMLVLLIMLIITIPIMTHAVKLDMPQASNPPPIEIKPEVIDLEVDFDGTVVWNGTVVPAAKLENLFPRRGQQGAAARDPPATGSPRQVRCGGEGARRSPAQPDAQDRIRQHG